MVEIGPSNTLLKMMKQTRQRRFAAGDQVLDVSRQFLGPQDGLEDIYYRHGGVVEEAREERGKEGEDGEDGEDSKACSREEEPPTQKTQDVRAVLASPPRPSAPPPASWEAESELADARVPASALVLGIVASKLKKSVEQVSLKQTLNGLAGGEF